MAEVGLCSGREPGEWSRKPPNLANPLHNQVRRPIIKMLPLSILKLVGGKVSYICYMYRLQIVIADVCLTIEGPLVLIFIGL